ncbi:PREDICTED: nephrin [Nicrophorus vespilloides]|uniref:Nephrin n=1 Tax=Nicrophorus vespilloides TaxID=110193 RepID=A0ABM1M9J5_NICVS|nr:PREDICTED: nephrin [Nicrophorus vespilloides]
MEVVLILVLCLAAVGLAKIENSDKEGKEPLGTIDSTTGEVVVAQDIQAVEGKSVSLPCDVVPPGHDKVYMVFWFQYGSGIPIYSFDVRGKPLSQARHWSAPEVFGSRAYFRTVSEPAQLVIDDIRRHDEGVYRCRVDFRNAQTRSFRYNLTVIVPPEQPTILDKWGRQLNGSVGPHEEGDDITLTCRTVGGHPQPVVRWMVNGLLVDDQYEHNAGDVIENRLVWPTIGRKDLDAIFTCQAVNTILTEPKEAIVMLDLHLKPLTATILKTVSPLVADRRYEVTCESAGSRPPAIITWYKGKRQLRRTKEENRENVTISELSFVPTTEDDGKSITCRAENPNVTGLFLETSWKIDVVYPPIVSLRLGSTLNPDDIKEGDDVYFECHVKANPFWRRLTWLHDGVVLNHNMSARIIRSNQSLVLQKVTRQSAGRYVCSAVNTEGETLSNELAFRVQYSPTCRYDRIVVVGASRGESIDILCEIESDPPAKSYRWKFNNSGETLDVAAERFAKTSNGTMSVLRYTPVSELDYGSLSCWASNSVGHQLNPCVFQVVAAGKPFPVKNCTLSNQTSSSVDVYCLPGFDGGLPQHFLLELYSPNSAVPRFNITSLDEPYFFLDNLEPDVTFRIVVFAANAKGRSNGVVLEEVTFKDAEKRTASDGELPISPIIGIIIGTALTIIVMMLVIIVVRRSEKQTEGGLDQKVIGGQNLGLSSTKPLLRSASPRDGIDERDPDIIPAKYGSPDAESERQLGMPSRGLIASPSYGQTAASSAPANITTSAAPHWVSISSGAPALENDPYHQYNNPVAMVGTFPRETRPKDLRLGNGSSATMTRATQQTDLELNGLAIKERLMANRLPESCV